MRHGHLIAVTQFKNYEKQITEIIFQFQVDKWHKSQ